MKKATRILALVLCAVMCLGLFVGCGNKGKQNNDTPLVVGYSPFNSKFSPFFSETAYDQDVWVMTAISLLNSDRQGAIIMKGIEGETKAYNGTDYTYHGPADCEIKENTDGTVDYNFKLREDLKFSDGEPITIDDVIFSMYVLCDPTYDGNSTLFALPIEGMDAYRSGMDTLYNLMLAAGRDNTDFTNNKWTEEEQTAFWADVDQAGVKFVQDIMQYCIAEGANAEGDSVAACMKNWGYDLPADATEADAFNAILAKYDTLTEAVDKEKANATFTSLLNDYETKYTKGIETGTSAANISGIKKTGDYSMTVSLTQVDATAIYQLGVTIAPMHYYGEKTKYNYENNQFGFDKGDLSHVREKTTTPLGAGPYKFMKFENGTVNFEANDSYYLGAPKTKYVNFLQTQEDDKLNGVVTGTVDITDPSFSSTTVDAIKAANKNDDVNGPAITTDTVDNLGYGYLGMSANTMNVNKEPGSDASKAYRKAFATVLAAYRTVAIESYYGERASVINYPISNTSWAAPQAADPGYKVAFSVDAQGKDIYTSDMTDEQKYEAALQVALTFFEAAGCKVENGKVVSNPEGGMDTANYAIEREALIPADGKGDHPSFMILTEASKALEKIGVHLIVTDLSDSTQLWDTIEADQADMWAAAWSATPDPDMYQIYFSGMDGKAAGGSNYMYDINDAELNQLILDARNSLDQSYRKTLYKSCLDIIVDWAVEVPVYQRQNAIIFSTARVNMNTVTPDITTFYGWLNEVEKIELN